MAVASVSLADSLDAHLAAEGYGPVSELKFYTHRPVFYQRSSSRLSQFDLWPKDVVRGRLLFVQPRSTKGVPNLCKGALRVSDVTAKLENFLLEKTSEYRWWLCDGVNRDSSGAMAPENGKGENG